MADLPDDYDVALLRGLAVMVDDAGIGKWRPDTPYVDGERAVVLDALPQQPVSAIALQAYTLSDTPTQHTMQVGFQVVCREPGASMTACRNTAAALFRLWHDRTHLVIGGLHVSQIRRQSAVAGGREGDAWRIIQNFYADLDAPPPTPPEETP